jgi:HAD superfamily hydrolase (TIGR01509 family)
VPGAAKFVKALVAQGLPLAVASTAVRQDVDAFFRKAGLTAYFPERRIITKEKVTHLKPHPEVFDAAFRSFGFTDSDRVHVLAFEDDPRGVMSAKAAGLTTCAITTRFDRPEWESLEVAPDYIADSFAEFEQLFSLRLSRRAAAGFVR